MTERPKVIGLGNPIRGDDAVGIRVIEALAGRALSGDPDLIEAGQAGLSLVTLIDHAAYVILVDCAQMGLPPGEVRLLAVGDVVDDGASDLHGARAATAIRMARSLGMMPESLTLIGIQPARTGWGEGMSPETERAVDVACEMISALLKTRAGGRRIRNKGQDHVTTENPDR